MKDAGGIGLWWYYKKPYSCQITIEEAELTKEQLLNTKDTHAKLWPEIKTKYGLPGNFYHNLPRGRVLYAPSEKLFLIYGPEKLLNSETFKKQIITEFNLPAEVNEKSFKFLIFLNDIHYEDYLPEYLTRS